MLETMLERVWWCEHSKMESWSWTSCCSMNYSKGGNTRMLGVVGDWKLLWGVVGNGKCCCQLMLRLKEGRDVDWPFQQLWWRLQGPNSLNRLLGWRWLSIWSWCCQKLLEKKLVYGLKVLLGYQRILHPKGAQTFEGRKSKKKQGILWKWKMEVCIIIDGQAHPWVVPLRTSHLDFPKPIKLWKIIGYT